MDLNNLRGLMEAYQQVNAPQDIEELYKGKHGQSDKEYADSRSPGGKMVSGDSKRSGAEYTHGRRVKAANPGMQPDVGGKTKPKSQGKMDAGTRADLQYRKANLKKEELDIFDVVLEFLQAEGFAETLEEAEWMMANMIDEEAIDIILGEGNPIARFLSNRKHRLRDTEKGHEDIMRRNKEYQTKGKGPGGYRNKGAGRVEKVREEYMDEAQQLDEISDKKVQKVVNARNRRLNRSMDSGAPNKEFHQAWKSNRLAARRNERTGSNVKVDSNLAKEEFVDESQEARNNPEKYEREQSKKTAPVRGERTPMPPRGDKRREDFEKWYAKQMGR